jgi:hypothetical protein
MLPPLVAELKVIAEIIIVFSVEKLRVTNDISPLYIVPREFTVFTLK